MTREEAATEAARRQREDPSSTWTVVRREDEWALVRIGLKAPRTPSGTATKPPPEAPPEGPPDRELRGGLWG